MIVESVGCSQKITDIASSFGHTVCLAQIQVTGVENKMEAPSGTPVTQKLGIFEGGAVGDLLQSPVPRELRHAVKCLVDSATIFRGRGRAP